MVKAFRATDTQSVPDSKAHGANMGPIWGRQGPGGPHVGPMNFAIWGITRNRRYVWIEVLDSLIYNHWSPVDSTYKRPGIQGD